MANAENNQYRDAMMRQIARQDDEPMDAYQGFLVYSGLHFNDRKIENVQQRTGYMENTIREWCHKYNWIERASMVDAQRWVEDEENRQQLQEKDNRRFAEKSRQMKERIFDVTDKMLSVSEKILKDAIVADEEIFEGMVETADGREVPTYRIVKPKWKVSDIRGLVDSAVKNSRLAAELPTEIIQAKELPLPTDLSKLSPEELEAVRIKNLQKANSLGADIKIENDLNN